jgi:hypothetical protein
MNLKAITWKSCAPSFSPFDSDDPMTVYVITQAGIVELGGGEAIQIGMDQREASSVFVDQGKCRTAHSRWFGAQSVGNPSNQ